MTSGAALPELSGRWPPLVQLVTRGVQRWLAAAAPALVCLREKEARQWSAVLLSAADVPASVQLARRNFDWGFNIAVLKKKDLQTCSVFQYEFYDVWACAPRG